MYDKEPIGMNFVVGSVTTHQNNMPSVSVVYLDPETLIPVDFEIHAMDIDHANKYDLVDWYKVVDYKEEFGLPDLSPYSFFDYAKQMHHNEEYAKTYRSFRYLDNRNSKDDPCDYDCMMKMYCQVVSNEYDEWQACNNRNVIDLFSDSIMVTVLNTFQHDWYRKIE